MRICLPEVLLARPSCLRTLYDGPSFGRAVSMLPRERRTSLAMPEKVLSSASRAGPITDETVINLLLFGKPKAPERIDWKVALRGVAGNLLVSSLGHCLVARSSPAVVWMYPGSPYPKTRGYLNDVRAVVDCHVAVAETHLPRPHTRHLVVRHLNSILREHHASNLAYGTRRENAADRYSALHGVPIPPPEIELWRFHPRYAGLYVSNRGRFESRHFELVAAGRVQGYRKVTFRPAAEEKKRTFSVHRLVFEAFNGPAPVGLFVCHLDGDRQNNRLDNLVLGSGLDNARDRTRHGRTAHGEIHHHVTVPDSVALAAMRQCQAGESTASVARHCNLSPVTLHAWLSGRNRGYLSAMLRGKRYRRGGRSKAVARRVGD